MAAWTARGAAMPARKWTVWSWATAQQTWMGVAEGTEAEMKDVLARKRSAAARLLPSARFTATPRNEPPTEAPVPFLPPEPEKTSQRDMLLHGLAVLVWDQMRRARSVVPSHVRGRTEAIAAELGIELGATVDQIEGKLREVL